MNSWRMECWLHIQYLLIKLLEKNLSQKMMMKKRQAEI